MRRSTVPSLPFNKFSVDKHGNLLCCRVNADEECFQNKPFFNCDAFVNVTLNNVTPD